MSLVYGYTLANEEGHIPTSSMTQFSIELINQTIRESRITLKKTYKILENNKIILENNKILLENYEIMNNKLDKMLFYKRKNNEDNKKRISTIENKLIYKLKHSQ